MKTIFLLIIVAFAGTLQMAAQTTVVVRTPVKKTVVVTPARKTIIVKRPKTIVVRPAVRKRAVVVHR